MTRFSRLEVLNTIVDTGLVPVFYHPDVEVVKRVAAACVAGGARTLEFTNRGDFAPQVFAELSQFVARTYPHLILGVGSVGDAPTAALYLASGAAFVVGPVLNPEVARLCNRRKIAYSPGCGSATEIATAEELGVEIVKVFPGDSVGGPGFVKAILGPCPWTRIMPTGGVEATRDGIAAWFKAGVAAVGVGSNLIRKEFLESGQYEAIATHTAQLLGWIREARGKALFEGVEHVCWYPGSAEAGRTVAEWYRDLFGFKSEEGAGSFFLQGGGPGRLEVSKEPTTGQPHLAIRVADFEQAQAALRAKGVDLEEPIVRADAKLVFLKPADPAGCRVHLVWRP